MKGKFIHSQTKSQEKDTPREVLTTSEPLTEGLAKVIFRKGEVFYNNAQVVNRDLSVLMLRYFVSERRKEIAENPKRVGRGLDPSAQRFSVLEALSATGLRALRYHLEVDGLGRIVANDLDPGAVETIRRNVEFNGVSTEMVVPNQGDAVEVMMDHRKHELQFDVVDLDPYGSASQLLDSAVQSVAEYGLLCVTCTDTAVLCGSNMDPCFPRYGSLPIRTEATHEFAIRIVLHAIQTCANRYHRHIEPILSLSIDFYVRVFVRIRTSKNDANQSSARTSIAYCCNTCSGFRTQPLGRIVQRRTDGANAKSAPAQPMFESLSVCEHCGGRLTLGGPFYSAPLHDLQAVQRLTELLRENSERLNASEKVGSLLKLAASELENECLFLHLPTMCHVLHCQSPPHRVIRQTIREAGFRESESHTCPVGLKTNAPHQLVWDILRCWARVHPPKSVAEDSPAARILAKQPTLVQPDQIDWEGGPKGERKPKGLRFPKNPANWGPKARARARPESSDQEIIDSGEKRVREMERNENSG